MSQIKYQTRLSYRRNLDKGDVESNYASLVSSIGGTYFINGNTNTNVTGQLDWRNFSLQAGIPNAMRVNPFGIVAVNADLGAMVTTNSTYFGAVPLPVENVGIVPTVDAVNFTLVGASAVLRDPSNAVNGGNITVIVRRRGVDITVIGPNTWTNVPSTRVTSVLFTAALNTQLQPRDVLLAKFVTTAAGVGYSHVLATFFLKGKHTRG